MRVLIFCLFIFWQPLFAEDIEPKERDYFEIKEDKVVTLNVRDKMFNLVITDDCAHCERQLSLLNDCKNLKKESINIFFDNKKKLDHKKLKRLIIRKKSDFDILEMEDQTKAFFNYKGVTPHWAIYKNNQLIAKSGFMDCQSIDNLIHSKTN